MLAALANHKGRQDLFLRSRPEALEAIRTAALVESSESSNRLRGVNIPRARVNRLVLKQGCSQSVTTVLAGAVNMS
jgi:hypothetical protein